MIKLLKYIYFCIPFKRLLFSVIREFYLPPQKITHFLRFHSVFKMNVNGKKLKIKNFNSEVETILFWHGIKGYEMTSLDFWIKCCENATYILDIGSNTGVYSLFAKAINKNAKVFAFDPIQRNIQRLDYNNKLNNFNIHTYQKAISNYIGSSIFYDIERHDNLIGSFDKNFTEKFSAGAKIKEIEVEVDTIDNFCSKNNIPVVDLVKIDTEGAEFEVIQGMKKIIERDAPVILIEISSKELVENIYNFTNELSFEYKILNINERNGISPYDSSNDKGRNYILLPENKKNLI